ncbi:virulence [Acidaminococcus massiliensis]|uniref:virulence n=1 Tax=Acidaminococcus massiliensis TaxID=1852375 RepID=UPI00094EF05B|nr:virulence [Acidaminococcus massiliensis]
MKVEYNRQGAARKELVQAISAITGEKAKYLCLPTKAYQIGSIMVWKNGAMECEDGELFQKVVKELEAKGIKPEETAVEEPDAEQAAPVENPEPEPSQETAEPEEVTEPETAPEKVDTLTISLPDDFTEEDFEKLQNLVASKAGLFKKALGTDDLTIIRSEGKINFPWFHEADSAKVQAYSRLVTALCQFAKNAKRVTAKEHEVPNEKYAFRCFLLRLGFIGKEYKDCRKILLEKLSGSAAFRNGGKKDAVSQ